MVQVELTAMWMSVHIVTLPDDYDREALDSGYLDEIDPSDLKYIVPEEAELHHIEAREL